jgi:acetyl esterase/lipase
VSRSIESTPTGDHLSHTDLARHRTSGVLGSTAHHRYGASLLERIWEKLRSRGPDSLIRVCIRRGVAFYTPVDFLGDDARAKGAPGSMKFLLGDDVSDARLKAMSPLTYVDSEFAPTLLLTGNRDELVDSGQTLQMYEALRTAGAEAELHVFDGAPHAFDLLPEFGRQCATPQALFLDASVLNPRRLELPSS